VCDYPVCDYPVCDYPVCESSAHKIHRMYDSPEMLLFLCVSALAAGIVNSLAGRGTLLTFSALMIALAPLGPQAAVLANGTSTVSLLPGSMAGAWGYRRQMAQ